MRQSLIAAWALVALLFAVATVGAHLPEGSTPLPPGVQIPTASRLALPDPACLAGPAFVAESAC
jgi:hypothetical protein